MASIDKFNEHCWKDVIPEADLELYAGWRRETFVGARPALLAIDLYDLVYRGGPHSPNELNARYPNSCGVFAHRAIAPTKRLLAAVPQDEFETALAKCVRVDECEIGVQAKFAPLHTSPLTASATMSAAKAQR